MMSGTYSFTQVGILFFLKSSTTTACDASKGVTAEIGFPVPFSADIFSFQPFQLFYCSAIFAGSVTLPAEHL